MKNKGETMDEIKGPYEQAIIQRFVLHKEILETENIRKSSDKKERLSRNTTRSCLQLIARILDNNYIEPKDIDVDNIRKELLRGIE